MAHETLTALAAFAFIGLVTPGPNNLMLLASGANFGFRRTLPHVFGITAGFAFMLVLTGNGLTRVFEVWPASLNIIRIAGILYMFRLAWKIAHAVAPCSASAGAVPMTLFQAALFQWVNPKAWALALTVLAVFAPGPNPAGMLPVVLIFALVTLPAASTWIFAGQQLRRLLQDPFRLRAFNLTMAVLLVASLLPVLLA